MYARAVRYLADIYKFDFLIYPNLDIDVEITEEFQEKVLKRLNTVLDFFDGSAIQLLSRKWANQVCLEGVYYGYICDDINDKFVVQDLPTDYCRSQFRYQGRPVIEFNLKYFDKVTNDEERRKKILKLFPPEFEEGYRKYKKGKLPAET